MVITMMRCDGERLTETPVITSYNFFMKQTKL